MKALVLGVGRMGTAIAWAMQKLGYEVVGVDANLEAANNMPKGNKNFFVVDDAQDMVRAIDYHKHDVDIAISSLPYHQTEIAGKYCVDNGVRYCDLGGRVDVSQTINEYANNNAVRPVFTDLGLAPGLVNILAEEGYRKLYGTGRITSIEMMVGGLPDYLESGKNPLRYGITWSVDGLINEYRDDCIVLENGQIKTVKGMDGLQSVESESLGKLEAFYTSGGASHSIHSMQKRGVQNCSYKTLRYKGHCDIIKFLIRDCDLDDETLNKIFITGCGHANKDEVIVLARVHKDNKTWSREKLIKSDDQFSAMQKATAFSIASVAALMGDGVFDGAKDQHRSYYTNYDKALSYADVPFEEFSNNLYKLGIDIRE